MSKYVCKNMSEYAKKKKLETYCESQTGFFFSRKKKYVYGALD